MLTKSKGPTVVGGNHIQVYLKHGLLLFRNHSKMKAKIKKPEKASRVTESNIYYFSPHFVSYPDVWDDIIENDEIINVTPAVAKAFGDYKFIYQNQAYWIPHTWLSLTFPEFTEKFTI